MIKQIKDTQKTAGKHVHLNAKSILWEKKRFLSTRSIINLGNPNGPMRTPKSGQCFSGKLNYRAAQVDYEKQDVDKSGTINFGGQ